MTDTPIRAESAPANCNLAPAVSLAVWQNLLEAEREAYAGFDALGKNYPDEAINVVSRKWHPLIESVLAAPVGTVSQIRTKLDFILKLEAHEWTIAESILRCIADDLARCDLPPANAPALRHPA